MGAHREQGPTPVFWVQVILELMLYPPFPQHTSSQLSFRVVGLSFLSASFIIKKDAQDILTLALC